MAHAAEIELKRIPGTREVTTLGGPGRVVRVIMDAERMNAYGVYGAGHPRRPAGRQRLAAVRQPGREQPRNAGADRHLPDRRPRT